MVPPAQLIMSLATSPNIVVVAITETLPVSDGEEDSEAAEAVASDCGAAASVEVVVSELEQAERTKAEEAMALKMVNLVFIMTSRYT